MEYVNMLTWALHPNGGIGRKSVVRAAIRARWVESDPSSLAPWKRATNRHWNQAQSLPGHPVKRLVFHISIERLQLLFHISSD